MRGLGGRWRGPLGVARRSGVLSAPPCAERTRLAASRADRFGGVPTPASACSELSPSRNGIRLIYTVPRPTSSVQNQMQEVESQSAKMDNNKVLKFEES